LGVKLKVDLPVVLYVWIPLQSEMHTYITCSGSNAHNNKMQELKYSAKI